MQGERRLKKQIENERRKKRLVVYTLFFLTAVYLASTFFFSDVGIVKYMTLNRNKQKLIREIAALEEENAAIKTEIDNLHGDPFYLERHAREDLNLSRPDELTFIYEK